MNSQDIRRITNFPHFPISLGSRQNMAVPAPEQEVAEGTSGAWNKINTRQVKLRIGEFSQHSSYFIWLELSCRSFLLLDPSFESCEHFRHPAHQNLLQVACNLPQNTQKQDKPLSSMTVIVFLLKQNIRRIFRFPWYKLVLPLVYFLIRSWPGWSEILTFLGSDQSETSHSAIVKINLNRTIASMNWLNCSS